MTIHQRLAVLLLLLVPGRVIADEPSQTGPDSLGGMPVQLEAEADAATAKIVSDSLAQQFDKLQLALDRKIAAGVSAQMSAMMLTPPIRAQSTTATVVSQTADKPQTGRMLYAVATSK